MNAGFVADAPTSGQRGGLMWPLLAVAASIVCWSVGEDWRQEMIPLTQQLKSASTLAKRGAPQEILALRQQAQAAARQRREIELQLKAEGDLELVRAYLNSDLRRVCLDSLAKNCAVRLADDSLTDRASTAASPATATTTATTTAAKVTGAAGSTSLGILRARATVSGLFETDEPVRLLQLLSQDSGRVWRTNGVMVRGNSFEVDVERLVLVPTTVSSR
jgi:hypothetical protein